MNREKLYTEFITKTTGIIIKKKRESLGVSLRELYKQTSISIAVWSDLENGIKLPRIQTLIEMLSALDIPFEKIFSQEILIERLPQSEEEILSLTQQNLIQEGLTSQDIFEIMELIQFKKDRMNKRKGRR